ncbi:unnamed protein product [Arctogadus glacialis]
MEEQVLEGYSSDREIKIHSGPRGPWFVSLPNGVLQILEVTEGDGGPYRCVASNSVGRRPSGDAVLTVTTGSSSFTTGSSSLTTGSSYLTTSIYTLTTGSSSLLTSSSTLTTGSSSLTTSSPTLTTGSSSLTTGSSSLTTGSSSLTAGSSSLKMCNDYTCGQAEHLSLDS